jgi:hypothetical protein
VLLLMMACLTAAVVAKLCFGLQQRFAAALAFAARLGLLCRERRWCGATLLKELLTFCKQVV